MTMYRITKTTVPVLGAAALLALTGCGGSSDTAESAPPSHSESSAVSSAAPSSDGTASGSATGSEGASAAPTGGAVTESSASDGSTGTQGGAAPAAGGPSSDSGLPSSAQPTCSGQSGQQAAEENLGKLPAPSVSGGAKWTTQGTDLSRFDDCAALSAIPVSIQGGTVSSPYQIMLFSHGKYIGTATKEDYGWAPSITRLSDDQLQITYSYAQGNDANARPSGKATSVFSIDGSGQITRSGELPPTGGQG